MPQRNRIIVAGDFNTPLKTSHPHVGPGITTHSSAQQKDQRVFQTLLQGLGLVAANTWSRAGPASATFVNHRNQSVQIDFVLLRQPCNVPALQTTILKDSLLVSDTGMRHYPIRLCVPKPTIPKRLNKSPTLTAAAALSALQDRGICRAFVTDVDRQTCGAWSASRGH